MLSSLECRNYRSLESVDIELDRLTAFVGPNGSGKTTILRALNVVLGQAWPSIRSFSIPQHFTGFDASTTIELVARFRPALSHKDELGKEHEVTGFRLRCAPYRRRGKWGEVGDLHASFDPIGSSGEPPDVAVGWGANRRPQFRPLSVSTLLRDQARILFIDHRRSVVQHLPATRGSVLGRLLEPARREFDRLETEEGESVKALFRRRYEAAMDLLRTPRIEEMERTVAETAKSTLGFLGSTAVADLDITFGFVDPANPFGDLRVEYREGNLTLPAQDLGLGVQSAIVVGIFEALRRLGGDVGAVVIEEPEMYLHPQAQRYFYRLLAEMADRGEAQIIMSTHSPIFADATRFESIRLVRREPGRATRVTWVQSKEDHAFLKDRRDALKLLTSFDPTRGEIFFARRVLLVEGLGDQLAVRRTAEALGVDLDAENLAVVGCGSKSAIPFFVRTCRAVDIPTVVLHDEDVFPEEGDDDAKAKIRAANQEANRLNEDLRLAVAPGVVFTAKPSLEGELGIGRNATDKPRRVMQALKTRALADFPEALVGAVRKLIEVESPPPTLPETSEVASP